MLWTGQVMDHGSADCEDFFADQEVVWGFFVQTIATLKFGRDYHVNQADCL
jgi:hypothetical protein